MLSATRAGRLLAALSLLAMTACGTTHKKGPLGHPENPYPLDSPAKVGDIVHLPTGTLVTQQQMNDVVTDARIVYVGETHDNPASHRLELETLQAMETRHPGRVALGMEMFTRSQQPALDRFVAGEIDEKEFLKSSKWYENWKMDFAYYRDLMLFAREKRIPVVALNADKSTVQAVRTKQPDQLNAEEKAQIPELFLSDPYQRAQTESIFSGHSHGKMAAEGFLRVQTLWDETMAESAARYLASPEGKDRRLLVIAGANHVNYGFGIPRRVFRRLPTSYALIGGREVAIARETKPETMNVELPEFPMVQYDFLVHYAYEELPKRVLLGVTFEAAPEKKGLVVTNVLPGSNAERAGVQKGDLLLSLDGEPLNESLDLVYAVQQKKADDPGVLKVERQGETLTLDVIFKKGGPAAHAAP